MKFTKTQHHALKSKGPSFLYSIIEKKNCENSLALQHINNVIVQQFSSGVRLQELTSVAIILSSIIPLLPSPDRNEKRSYNALLGWFHKYWDMISPILPLIQLRDENNMVINQRRELLEMISK